MSAIWGIIDLDKNELANYEALEDIFHRVYSGFRVDSYQKSNWINGLMGCELQFFTKESRNEKFPYTNDDTYFVADVYLYNRNELLEDSIFDGDDVTKITDGELLFKWYMHYGNKRISEVLGSYSFVYYDRKNNKVDLVMDHTGNRCLYYAVVDNKLVFSTLIEPIFKIYHDKMSLNEEVLAIFLAGQDYMVYLDYEATIINEIKHTVPGTIISVSKNNITKCEYWKPQKIYNSCKNKSDKEYKKLIVDCFEKSIDNMLRNEGKVAISLSGGLDSTSVACFAAPILKKRGKNLYSYTMVPVDGYIKDVDENVSVDESELVHETAKFLGNVTETYDSNENLNAWDALEEQLDLLEGPFKSLQNVMNLKHICELARDSGCKVMLDGGIGNNSISYGGTLTYLYELAISGHFIKLYNELNTKKDGFKYNKKKSIKFIIENIFGVSDFQITSKEDFYNNSLINRETLDKYNIYKQFHEREKKLRKIKTRRRYMDIAFDKMTFRQIGDNETRISLETGVLSLDPTKNPRVLEMCWSFPTEQFNKECTARRIIYSYFKEFLPDMVLDRKRPRGRQSADFIKRLEPQMEMIIDEMKNDFSHDNKLLDCQKIMKKLEQVDLTNRKEIEWLIYCEEVLCLQKKYM